MTGLFQLDLSKREMLMLIEQLYMNILLDLKQHELLEEKAKEDVDYKERQEIRTGLLLKMLDLVEIPDFDFEGLKDLLADLEEEYEEGGDEGASS